MASIIGVETLQHTNGTTAATIDSSGRIKSNNPCGFKVRLDSANQGITTATLTKVQFDDAAIDTQSGWDGTNYKYVIPSGCAGYWLFYAFVELNFTPTEGALYLSKVNAPSSSSDYWVRSVRGENSTTSQNLGMSVQSILNVSVGDEIYTHFNHNYGSNIDIQANTEYDRSFMMGWRLF